MPLPAAKKIDIVGTNPRYLPGWNQPKPEDEFLHLSLGGDYDRYIEMRRDAHIRAKLEKRVNSLLARPLIFEGGKRPQDVEAIEIAKKLADTMGYDSLCEAVLDTGPLVGFAVLQLEEVKQDVEVILDQKVIRKSLITAKWQYVPQNRFRFSYHEPENLSVPVATDEELDPATEIMLVGQYELRLLTVRSPFWGERCPKNSFMFFQFGFGQGTPWGLGLGYSLYPWWSIKREAVRAWILHAENTGQSPVAANLPENFNPETSQVDRDIEVKVKNFLEGVSPNNWVMLPYGITVELLSDLADKPDVLERLIALCNTEMSKILLGEVSYSENGTGSYAANESQVDDIQSTTIDADANLFDNQAQQSLWNRLLSLNAPKGQAVRVRRESRSDIRLAEMERSRQEQLGTTLTRDKQLLEMGWRRTSESVAETYGAIYEQTQGENKEPPLITTLGVGGIQAFTSLLAASGIQSTRESTIKTISTMFGVDEEIVALMVPEDNRPEQPSLESLIGGGADAAPPPPETPPEDAVNLTEATEDFGAIIDRVIKWNGVELGVEYLPGQVRFPGRKHSRKLRSGYGHIRRHVGADGEALDCYLHPDFFDDVEPIGKIYEVAQLDEDREFDEHKLMLGWGTIGEAKDAYLVEMPRDRFGGIMPLALDKLAQYAKPSTPTPIEDEDQDEYFDGVEMSEEEADWHLAGSILAVMAGTYDFATATSPKKMNCNPAKSHFCAGKKGGACVSVTDKCAIPATGIALKAALAIFGQKIAELAQTEIPLPFGQSKPVAKKGAVPPGKKGAAAPAQSPKTALSKAQMDNLTKKGWTKAQIQEVEGQTIDLHKASPQLQEMYLLGRFDDPTNRVVGRDWDAFAKFGVKAPPNKNTKLIDRNSTGSHDTIPRSGQQKHFEQYATKEHTGGEIADAISRFSADESGRIREFERTGKEQNGTEKKYAAAINSYIAQAPKFKGQVHRGLTFDKPEAVSGFLKQLTQDGGLELDAMSSFSSDRNIAKSFDGGNYGVLIKVKANQSGTSIKNGSSNSGENEVLIPKGTKYRISGKPTLIVNGAGRTTIELELEEIE
jgi:hypothetical protein